MKHLKTTLLAFALLFSVNALMAQQKYDYAAVSLNPFENLLAVSVNGTDYTEEKIDKSKTGNRNLDINPLLSKVNEMEEQGWEVMSTGFSAQGIYMAYVFYLRKKEQ